MVALGYGFTKNWLKSERLKQMLVQEKLVAELNFLKSQINPHFLFNVLNMAFSSATSSGDEKTADIVEKLSGLMRYMLYDGNVDRVNLEKELEFLTQYIDLQKKRLAADIPTLIHFETEGCIHQNRIAPLILIPFIENAFKYGISLDKPGDIRINLSIRDRILDFRVQNTMHLPAPVNKNRNSGIGLENVKKRLDLLYPGKNTLEIENSGSLFTVKLLMMLD
jgi:LytS/YehU family sensor histidine kinase